MADLSEARLIEKLRALEALYARPGTTAEGRAAADAAERIQQRLAETQGDKAVEYRFSMADMWSRRVFVALLRRYGIRPYRYRRQRYTTVMAKVSQRFVDETLWPQYEAFSDSLREYLAEVTDRVVSQVLHDDLTEAAVIEEPPQLTLPLEPKANGSPKSPHDPSPPPTAKTSSPPPPSPSSANNRERNKRKRKRKNKRR